MVRLSTGARNGLAQGLGFGGLFNGGRIEIYSGSQPTTADSAATGTLLGTVTSGSGALTKETRASATLTVTGGSGTLTAVTVGTFDICPDITFAPVVWLTDTTVTAALIAQAINRNGHAEATSSGAVSQSNCAQVLACVPWPWRPPASPAPGVRLQAAWQW